MSKAIYAFDCRAPRAMFSMFEILPQGYPKGEREYLFHLLREDRELSMFLALSRGAPQDNRKHREFGREYQEFSTRVSRNSPRDSQERSMVFTREFSMIVLSKCQLFLYGKQLKTLWISVYTPLLCYLSDCNARI